MKPHQAALAALSALALAAVPAAAQTSVSTKVTHDTGSDDGVPTHTTKVVHTVKRKTHRPKKILGVKVGHKTVETKVTRQTTTSADGDVSHSVKVTH